MPKEHLYTGMLGKEWNKENSLRPGKISPFLKRTMRKLAFKQLSNDIYYCFYFIIIYSCQM